MTEADADVEESSKREGTSAAAYDLADTRFRLHENETKISTEELSKKYAAAFLFGLILLYGVIGGLNYFDPPETPLFWINVTLGLITPVIVIWSWVHIVRRNREISKLWVLRRKLRDAEKDARIRISDESLRRILWNYHSDVASSIDDYRANARRYRNRHNRFQTFIIISSLAVTGVTTASAQFMGLEWVAVVLSFLVAVATGITGYFKFRERAMNLQRAADDLEYEYNSVELGINNYRANGSEEEKLKEFAERSETIKSEQRKREQQLEQPPESRAAASGGENGST